jgi:transmembrane sensor
MNRQDTTPSHQFTREQFEQATDWVAKAERGFTVDEQAAFDSWLAADPRHAESHFEAQVEWTSLDTLDECKPNFDINPNPDLLAPRPRRAVRRYISFAGIAAALMVGFTLFWNSPVPDDSTVQTPGITYRSMANEKHFLSDGSSFYLLADSELEVAYTQQERSIRFIRGEAHFSVAHDPDRPFTVKSNAGKVTAIGTAFSVKHQDDLWELFVTEGKVRVDAFVRPSSTDSREIPQAAELEAGEKMFRSLINPTGALKISQFTAGELRTKLAWKDQIIDMVSAPLEEILEEFSRFNDREVIVLGQELRQTRMSVAIKPDNLDDFIDLLELSAGVKVSTTASGAIILSNQNSP